MANITDAHAISQLLLHLPSSHRSFWWSSYRCYGIEDDAVEGIRSRIPDRSSLVDEKVDREEGKGDEIMLCRSDERHHRSSSSSSSASSYGGCMEYDTYEERAVLRNIAEDVNSLVRRYALTEEEKKELAEEEDK